MAAAWGSRGPDARGNADAGPPVAGCSLCGGCIREFLPRSTLADSDVFIFDGIIRADADADPHRGFSTALSVGAGSGAALFYKPAGPGAARHGARDAPRPGTLPYAGRAGASRCGTQIQVRTFMGDAGRHVSGVYFADEQMNAEISDTAKPRLAGKARLKWDATREKHLLLFPEG